MQMRRLTDEEIDRFGYEALKDRLGVLGATRFIGLQLERSRENYVDIREKIFEGMTVEQIYEEAVRLESEREKERNNSGKLP